MQKETDPGCYRQWFSDWRFWMTLITIVITASIAWGNLRMEVKVNTGTIATNSGRISTLETTVGDMVKEQPLRDYILGEIARKQNIRVPRSFGARPE